MTLRKKFMLYILVLLIFSLIVVPVIGFQYVRKLISRQMLSLSSANLQQIAVGINSVVDDMIASSNLLAMDSTILDILEGTSSLEYRSQQVRSIQNSFKSVEAGNLFAYSADIMLLDMKGNIYSNYSNEPKWNVTYEDIANQPFFEVMLSNNKSIYWLTSEKQYYDIKKMPFNDGLILARLVRRNFDSRVLGILLVHISQNQTHNKILNTASSEFDYMKKYLVDLDGNIIIRSENTGELNYQSELFMEILSLSNGDNMTVDDEKVMILHTPIQKTAWNIIAIVPYKELMQDYEEYTRFFILMNTMFMFLITLAAFFLSGRITSSIRSLDDLMKEVSKGDFSIRSNISGSLEINSFSKTFNIMLDKIDFLLLEIERVTKEKERSRTQILQAQMTPHFLLNTLNGIKWLCVIEGAKTAEKMLISLGYLLEHSMQVDKELIRLSEELDLVVKYCDLQKMRYGHIFKLEIDVPEALLDAPVPILLLQPLVENCILHAFDGMDVPGSIIITAQADNNYILINIRDNGSGMAMEKLSLPNQETRRDRIGIQNVMERIQLYYGTDCGLMVQSSPGSGTTVTVKIKLIDEE